MSKDIGVVGAGLIGGSFVKGIEGIYEPFLWDQDEELRSSLRGEGYTLLEPEIMATRCDAIFLALPVLQTPSVATSLLQAGAKLVISAASAQEEIFAATGNDPRYWGLHPLTGSAESGWEAARDDLLRNVPWAVMSREGKIKDFSFIMSLVEAFGGAAVPVLSEDHDRALALTSHAIQVLHSALAALLADQPPLYHRLSGPALRDTTRLAESSLPMWREVLLANEDNIDQALLQIEQEIAKARLGLKDPRALWRHAEYGRESLLRQRWNGDQWRTRSVPLKEWWEGLLQVGQRGGLVRELRESGPLLYFKSSV